MDGKAEVAIAAATAYAAELGGQAARIEAEGRVPDDVAARLRALGAFSVTAPEFGGDPAQAWRLTFEIAKGCASCAWLVGLGAANVAMAAQFDPRAVAELFGEGRRPVVPFLTGGVGSDVRVEPAGGGVAVSGRWRYCSGIDIAEWVGVLLPGPGEPHVALVRAADFAVDHGSWTAFGMRGTGSKAAALTRAVVPAHRLLAWAKLQAGPLPLNVLFAQSVLAPTLGVASAVVEAFAAILKTRVRSGTGEAQLADKTSHILLGEAAANLAGLRKSLLDDARAIAGGPLSLDARAEMRTRIALSGRAALATCQRLFAALGGSLLPQGTRIERQFRDLHAMASHFLLQPEIVAENYGRHLLGLDLPPTARF